MAVKRFEAYIKQADEQASNASFELEVFTKKNAKVVREYKWLLSVKDAALKAGDEYRRQRKQATLYSQTINQGIYLNSRAL